MPSRSRNDSTHGWPHRQSGPRSSASVDGPRRTVGSYQAAGSNATTATMRSSRIRHLSVSLGTAPRPALGPAEVTSTHWRLTNETVILKVTARRVGVGVVALSLRYRVE